MEARKCQYEKIIEIIQVTVKTRWEGKYIAKQASIGFFNKNATKKLVGGANEALL